MRVRVEKHMSSESIYQKYIKTIIDVLFAVQSQMVLMTGKI